MRSWRPSWRAAGGPVPSGPPPWPQGASSHRGHRALCAGPLDTPARSRPGRRGAEPADVSPGFPIPGTSPPPGLPERAPESCNRGGRRRDLWRRKDLGWEQRRKPSFPVTRQLQMGKPRQGLLAGSRRPLLEWRAPGCDISLLYCGGILIDGFWGTCGSHPGKAVKVLASLIACSAFSFSFPLSRGWFYTTGSSLVERRVLLKQGILSVFLYSHINVSREITKS